ncbi:MAG: hypothetical protein NC218_04120 [Acetobacter sp.]|nr:hypothetical protein [Acetobacter sp.]
MCNVELNAVQATVENTSYVSSVHDVVAIILFLAVLVISVLDYTIGIFLMVVKNITSWDNNPKVKMVKLIARGVIGITVAVYSAYLFATWSTCNWKIPFCVFILMPIMALLVSFVLYLLSYFSYKFLYEPLTSLITYFKKK